MKQKQIVLITGGTGGHVIPAVNFGNYLIDQGYNCHLFVDDRGYKYVNNFKGNIIKIYSIHFGYNMIKKIQFFIIMPLGFAQSIFHLMRIRPSVGIAFGSYASFCPLLVLIFCKYLGLSSVFLHEQNSVMGKVNSFFCYFVNKIFLNFKKTHNIKKKYIYKCYSLGIPSNHSIDYVSRNKKNIKNEIKRIFVLGGSQGAVNLNDKISKILIKLSKELNIRLEITMQCPKDKKYNMKRIFENNNINLTLDNYFDNILEILHNSDVLISRSGAGAINDIINTQTPSILIPLPNSTNQHQLYNAKYLENNKAALIIDENNLDTDTSYLVIKNLIKNIDLQNNFITSLQKIKKIDSNSLIAKEMDLI